MFSTRARLSGKRVSQPWNNERKRERGMERGRGFWVPDGTGVGQEEKNKSVARISPRLRVLNNYYFESESVTVAPVPPVVRNRWVLAI